MKGAILGALTIGVFATTIVAATRHSGSEPSSPPPDLPPSSTAQGTNTKNASGIEELIASLSVVDELPDLPGYDRDCGTGAGCVFGPAWTDDSTAPGSHNGCDTRNDVLGSQLTDVTYKPGTRNCKVLTATLHDPYTGRVIDFTFGQRSSLAVQIDHVYPLARSWKAGAAHWSIDKRVAFANDLSINLLAVDGPTNQKKSDSGLDTWMPPNTAYDCDYATRYLTVARNYDLAITHADANNARESCSQ
jgi:hypothetical protein